MATKATSEKYIKLIIYLVIIVLINLVSYSVFKRFDLTQNKIYSLSSISKKVVATLTEPLTIKVFFSENLPAPHNNTSQYIKDILDEYKIAGNTNFYFEFHDISSSSDENEKSKKGKDLAESYGINPVQIRVYEEDETKFINVYMGMVIIHGDLMEKIPLITDTSNLEYTLTTTMMKLNNKISALLGLSEKIMVELYMSSSLNDVAPIMKLNDMPQIPAKIESAVEKINLKNYGRLVFKHIDPSKENILEDMVANHNLMALKWNDIGDKVKAGEGGIGLVMKYKNKSVDIKLMDMVNIPIFGPQYQLVNMDDLEDMINGGVESLIDINEKIGYLADHGTLERMSMGGMMGQGQSELNSFNSIVSQNYSLQDVELAVDGIPSDIETLIIANPTENFTDYELYQIDQALMSGKNLALFLDSFKEVQQPNRQFGFNQGPSFQPIHTGLEKLLKHYGITMSPSYVMDESCYKQPMPQRSGGGELNVYYAPLIQEININHDLDFLKNINALITLRIAPLYLNDEQITKNEIKSYPLFSSSKDSWEMKGNINLDPRFLQPPSKDSEMKSYNLAYLLQGSFSSYFEGKPIPEKKTEEPAEEDKDKKEEQKPDLSGFKNEGGFIAKGQSAKILLVSSAEMLKDNMLDEEGRSPNATFILNAIDTLNGKDGIARMRSKKQSYNPLEKSSAMEKMGFKTFNIVGLPVLVVLFGLIVWLMRKSHKKQIQMMFQK